MITPALLRSWDACWYREADGEERIDSLLSGRPGLSPREVAGLEAVSLNDRLWVLCHALAHRDESAARTFAIDSAALVSHLAGRPEDQTEHARLVADLRRIYALPAGAARSADLARWDAARSAAWYAACAAAWYAACAAAWSAAWYAACDAAWYAAWSAACAAARDAARDAACDAACAAACAAAMRKALDRALIALGVDAEGWS